MRENVTTGKISKKFLNKLNELESEFKDIDLIICYEYSIYRPYGLLTEIKYFTDQPWYAIQRNQLYYEQLKRYRKYKEFIRF